MTTYKTMREARHYGDKNNGDNNNGDIIMGTK